MVPSDLPQELLIDIFSRLPAKSVGQCRCVSKPWCHVLSSPHFIKSHLNRKTHQQQSLLLVTGSQSPIATIKDGAVSRDLELPFDYPDIVGSCHGLVLLASKEYDEDKFLVNPVTLEKVIIPNSPLAFRDDGGKYFSMHGFGYDSSIDDYKIVTLSSYYYYPSSDEDEYEDGQVSDCAETCVDVYSVKKGIWERVESSPYNHGFHEPHSGTFLNGAIHWLARTRDSSYRSLLVAFDLFNEVFTEIPTPGDMKMENSFCFQPVVLGGCLGIIDPRLSSQANVWIMKEYGSVESWTKVSIDTCGKWGMQRPLCFVWDQEIVSAAEGRLLGVYNVKDGTLRDIIGDGVLAVLEDGVTFVPSLVSPANVHRSSLLDVSYHEASANLAQALKSNLVLVQHIKDYRTKLSALEQEDKEPELRKTRDELSELTRDHKTMQAVIRHLSEKLCEAAMSSFTKGMGRQAYKVSSQLQSDLYRDVVRICRRLLRECEVDEDVVMLVGPDVPDSC